MIIRKRSRDVFYAGVWALYRGSGSRQNAECNSTMFVERVHNCCFGVSFLDYGLPPSFSLSLSVVFSPFSLAHPPPQHTASCPCLETAHLVVSLVLIKSSSAARADLVLGEVGNRPPEDYFPVRCRRAVSPRPRACTRGAFGQQGDGGGKGGGEPKALASLLALATHAATSIQAPCAALVGGAVRARPLC